MNVPWRWRTSLTMLLTEKDFWSRLMFGEVWLDQTTCHTVLGMMEWA